MPKGIEKEKENTMSEEEGGGGKEMTFDEFYQFDIKANHPNQQTCKIRIKFSKDQLYFYHQLGFNLQYYVRFDEILQNDKL